MTEALIKNDAYASNCATDLALNESKYQIDSHISASIPSSLGQV
jgi:hypothetical protein